MLDIRPVSDLRNKFASVEKSVKESGKPVVLTKNGRGSMVLMSAESYHDMTRLPYEEYVERALDEAEAWAEKHGETLTDKDVFGPIRDKLRGKKV